MPRRGCTSSGHGITRRRWDAGRSRIRWGGAWARWDRATHMCMLDDAPVMMTDPSGRDAVGCFFSWIVSIADVISVIGTLVWFDPIAAAGIELLDAIPIVGIILSITGAVALIAFNVWAVEGTLYFDYQLIKSNCS